MSYIGKSLLHCGQCFLHRIPVDAGHTHGSKGIAHNLVDACLTHETACVAMGQAGQHGPKDCRGFLVGHQLGQRRVQPVFAVDIASGGLVADLIAARRQCRGDAAALLDEAQTLRAFHRIDIGVGQIDLRLGVEGDLDAVAELEKECFSVPWSRKSIADELTNDTAHFFVAKRFGSVIGYIGTNIIADECYITNVAVTQKERRQGVAQALLEKAEETAKEHNCRFITLEVRPSNEAAISLYSGQGYKQCGLRKNYYTAPDEDGLIMTKYFSEE